MVVVCNFYPPEIFQWCLRMIQLTQVQFSKSRKEELVQSVSLDLVHTYTHEFKQL